MRETIARKLTNWLKNTGEIEAEDAELYEFGLYSLISYLLGLLITVTLGLALGLVLEALLFFFAFKALREYAGGYHASTQFRCALISVGTVILFFLVLRFLPVSTFAYVMIAFPSSLVIFIFSPIEAVNKPLTKSESREYKKRARLILLLIGAVMITGVFLTWYQLATCLALVIIFCALQMIVAILRQYGKGDKGGTYA